MYFLLKRRSLVLVVFLLFCVVTYVSFHVKKGPLSLRLAKSRKNKPKLNVSKYPSPQLLPCRWVPETFIHPTRSQCQLHCSQTDGNYSDGDNSLHNSSQSTLPALTCRNVTNDTSVPTLPAGDLTCLKTFLQQNCYGPGHIIPRVAHYVRFGAFNLTLDAFLSMYSVARFLQPCVLLIHGDAIPSGPYWRALLHLLPNMVHVPTLRPREIFGRPINVVQHSSDVARLKILLEYGGVYLDFDQLLLNPLDDLLNRSTVLGNEVTHVSINNALMMATPGSEFLRIWLSRYTTFQDKQWSVHSTQLPVKLSQNYSHLVHVVDTFFRPVHPRTRKFYDTRRRKALRWRDHYGMHLYARLNQKVFYRGDRVDRQNHVMGDVVRYILYGDKNACMKR